MATHPFSSSLHSPTDTPPDTPPDASSPPRETMAPGETILVTGANGFVGQHVVRLLQEAGPPYVKEIRALDLLPFSPRMDYEVRSAVTSHVGSVTDSAVMQRVTKGVNSVIHIAGLVSYGTFPDFQGMERVNVDGTLNVVRACLHNNVGRLLYCSTVDVVVGFDPIRGGAEEDTPIPPHFLFPGYPETKLQGERLVLSAHRQPCQDGSQLHTLSLRANVMYGELDPYYVTAALQSAKSTGGQLLRVGEGRALFQQSYVGNTAAAFLQADAALRENPDIGGQAFFVPDDTPVQNSFRFMEPYLHCRGFTLSPCYLPYTLVHGLLFLTELILKGLSPLVKIHMKTASCSVRYINTDLYFRAEKARTVFRFRPLFSPEEAQRRSLPYYKSVKL
ncbi:3 beta-hydroxysteroid dehydrogenase/Delta 5--_4-isomerase type 4-like [Babylonia areolata]|uniref:3 beta-hydroxysteroid dehydrogenase/Delta 5-->4-isomerase type 4-like n=1 Tax=Babylonia areolata TaxID=304850 RepID=UPI003FD1396B